jgi:tetratricopeptide (TPR) repeat protein
VGGLIESGVRILLTSRSGEAGWLPDAVRLSLPPLRPADRLTLIAEVLAARGEPLTDVGEWVEKSTASQGNPMIIEALVDRVLRGDDGAVASDLVESLRQALSDVDREVLRGLALFQGITDINTLHFMGLNESRSRPVLARLSAVGAAQQVHDAIWLLHPSVPDLVEPGGDDLRERFVWSVGALAEKLHGDWRDHGSVGAVGWARSYEDNLLHAHRICLRDGHWNAITGVLSGLRVLYEGENRFETWDRVLEDLRDHVMLPDTGGARPGREYLWGFYTEFLVQRDLRNGDLERAFQLQDLRIRTDLAWHAALSQDPPDWSHNAQAKSFVDRYDPAERPRAIELMRGDLTRGIGVSFDDMGQILAAAGNVNCVDAFKMALGYFADVGDEASMARTLLHLSDAHCRIPEVFDLELADREASESLRLRAEDDFHGRAKSCGQLGNIALTAANQLPPEAEEHREPLLREAAGWLERALDAMPAWARRDTAPAHNQLGTCLLMLGELVEGRRHYVQAIADYEAVGEDWYAASSAINLAAGLLRYLRYDEAEGYASSALAFFRRIGDEEQTMRAEAILKVIGMMRERDQ